MLRASAAAGAVAVAILTACGGGGDGTPNRITYSAGPASSGSGGSEPTGTNKPVEMERQPCYSTSTEDLDGLHPAAWDVEPNGLGRCSWRHPKEGRLEFVYDEDVTEDQVWETWLAESQTAITDDEIPGYSFVRLSGPGEQRGPLWHYQYVEDRDGDSVQRDSFNIYRGHWRITYEADSAQFNSSIRDTLVDKVGPA